jgi:hypothetical protein
MHSLDCLQRLQDHQLPLKVEGTPIMTPIIGYEDPEDPQSLHPRDDSPGLILRRLVDQWVSDPMEKLKRSDHC